MARCRYYENLNLEATEKRWIAAKGGAIELLCDTTSGGVRQWGPGTSKDYPAKSCQQSLDVFKALKTGDKIYKSTDDGKVAEVKCIVSGGKATSNPDGTSKEGAAHSCMSIKALGGTKSGNYWVKLTKYGGSEYPLPLPLPRPRPRVLPTAHCLSCKAAVAVIFTRQGWDRHPGSRAFFVV